MLDLTLVAQHVDLQAPLLALQAADRDARGTEEDWVSGPGGDGDGGSDDGLFDDSSLAAYRPQEHGGTGGQDRQRARSQQQQRNPSPQRGRSRQGQAGGAVGK